jgi:hypothetical protein
MKYKHFIGVLLAYKKFEKDIDKLHDMGFDLMNGKYKLTHPVNVMLEETIKSHYGKEGLDWVTWFIYESDWGEKDWSKSPAYKLNSDGTSELLYEKGEVRFGAYDKNNNPICYSYESLWEYLEKKCKK